MRTSRCRFRTVVVAVSAVVAVGIFGCQAESSSSPPRMDVPTTASAMPRPTTLASTQASLAVRLESILTRHRDQGAILSARVVDPETGQQLFAYDAARPMAPASNMKLTVTSAALDFFGPDQKLVTKLIVRGQDLWLIGTGDPATGDEAIETSHGRTQASVFDDWAAELNSRGITTLAGNLYYVDNAFEPRQLAADWSDDDKVERYGAPIGGLNFNDNCIDTTVFPTTQLGSPVKFSVVPETTSTIVMINDGITGPTTMSAKTRTIDVTRARDQNAYTIRGEAVVTTKLDAKPVTDPGAFFADALRTHLAATGISIAGAIVHGQSMPDDSATTPIELKPAVTVMSDVLRRTQKNSQNLFAEGLAKYLGRAYARQTNRDPTAVGSWQNAEQAIRAFDRKNDIDDRDFRFHDGSGLSAEDRVTAKMLSETLATMYHHRYFDTFRKAMAIGGVDGTLKDRFRDTPNRVYAKTGYISGVRSLSGYAKTDSGKWIVFSILYNKIPGSGSGATKPYEALQDEAVRTLMSDPSAQ